MTTTTRVDKLHTALDDDHQNQLIRGALADALREAGDPLADGYVALVRLNLAPYHSPYVSPRTWIWSNFTVTYCDPYVDLGRLPDDWYDLVDFAKAKDETDAVAYAKDGGLSWVAFGSRREADDAAAATFLLLPESRRAGLLKG